MVYNKQEEDPPHTHKQENNSKETMASTCGLQSLLVVYFILLVPQIRYMLGSLYLSIKVGRWFLEEIRKKLSKLSEEAF